VPEAMEQYEALYQEWKLSLEYKLSNLI